MLFAICAVNGSAGIVLLPIFAQVQQQNFYLDSNVATGNSEQSLLWERHINAGKFIAIIYKGFSGGNRLPEAECSLLYTPDEDSSSLLVLNYLLPPGDDLNSRTSFTIAFLPEYFEQYPEEVLAGQKPFCLNRRFESQFALCSRAETLLEQLRSDFHKSDFASVQQKIQAAGGLLARAVDQVTVPFATCPVPACSFLAFEGERQKIEFARKLILQNAGKPYAIKDLARKVAMNECYLKKGFKAITGKSINEFQQELRMERAKEMLRAHKITVSEVAAELGFSSISHFSTAFKRITGTRPCELID